VSEVGFLEKDDRILPLEFEGMEKAHQGLVGLRPLRGAILKAPVPENHMRPNHPLGEIVIEGDLRDLEKGEKMKPMFQESLRESSKALIPIVPAGPEEEAFLEESDSPLINLGSKLGTNLFEFYGIPEDAFQDSVVFPKRLGLVFEIKRAHLPEEVDQAFLLLSRQPMISRIEVGHEHPPIVFGEDRFGNLGAPGLGNPVIGEPFIDHGPEPMVSAAHLPPRFIHMEVRARPHRCQDLLDFDPKPLTHPLEGLGQSPFRDPEMSKALKEFFDLIEGKPVVVLQDHGLNEDVGTQVPVRHFFGGIRGGHHLLAMGAVVAVFLKQSDLGMGRDQVFLDVFDHFLGFAQRRAAIGASLEGLLDHPVNRFGLHSGQALVPGFLTGRLGAACVLGFSQGLQEFLPGFAFLPFPEFSLKFLDFSFFLQDDFDEFFFSFLGEEDLAACFHNPNNGQEGDFFEGIPSGG
jgi:hypothetical protein